MLFLEKKKEWKESLRLNSEVFYNGLGPTITLRGRLHGTFTGLVVSEEVGNL